MVGYVSGEDLERGQHHDAAQVTASNNTYMNQRIGLLRLWSVGPINQQVDPIAVAFKPVGAVAGYHDQELLPNDKMKHCQLGLNKYSVRASAQNW